jgi:hypothetical protein
MVEKILFRVLMAVLVLGTLYRLFPIFTGQPQLSEFFMTEDGYLLLTVARNMAIGLGMSVSEGTIATNGVQPLVTFLFAIPYVLTGGDKVSSLVGIHLIAAAIALGGAFAVRAFAARVLEPQDDDPLWPWLVAGLWFTGPLLLLHTMNALETGLYTLFLLLSLIQFARVLDKGGAATLADRLLLGALCGLTFLARNDGAFLVTAIFAIWALRELFGLRAGFGATLIRVVPPGLLSLLIAAPWLINNKLKFGSIVPISGTAQSENAEFAGNLPLVPVRLFEHLLPMLPIPARLEWQTPVMLVTLAVVLPVLVWFFLACWRRGGTIRLVVAAYAVHGLLLVSYYGLFFGASHFLGRYLAPLAPLLILASVSVLLDLARRISRDRAGTLAAAAGLAGLTLSVLLLVRLLLPGVRVHEHFQVVRWVDENVPAETWVGAVQTGTLGYWHDRTINLDGKVNPQALAEKLEKGNVLEYIVNSEIAYLADWKGIAGWATKTDGNFDQVFELIVNEPARNLAVLQRRPAP